MTVPHVVLDKIVVLSFLSSACNVPSRATRDKLSRFLQHSATASISQRGNKECDCQTRSYLEILIKSGYLRPEGLGRDKEAKSDVVGVVHSYSVRLPTSGNNESGLKD